MFKRKVLSVAVVVAMMSSATSLYAADPAGEATLKMAPKGVSLIAHVEGKLAGELLQRFFKAIKADKELNIELANKFPIMDAFADIVTH
ncbi:MAG: hypothetical protein EHM48_10195, partial [Planctomycetaceae bacterium]